MLSTLGNGPGHGMMSPNHSRWGWTSGAEFSKPGRMCRPAMRSAVLDAAIWPSLTVITSALRNAPSPITVTPGSRRLHHRKTPIRT